MFLSNVSVLNKIEFQKCKQPEYLPPNQIPLADLNDRANCRGGFLELTALQDEFLILPQRFFSKKPIDNFHIAMHLLGSMNLFSDLGAVLK